MIISGIEEIDGRNQSDSRISPDEVAIHLGNNDLLILEYSKIDKKWILTHRTLSCQLMRLSFLDEPSKLIVAFGASSGTFRRISERET